MKVLHRNIFLVRVDRHSDQISQNSRTHPEAKYFDFTRYLNDHLRYLRSLSLRLRKVLCRNIFLARVDRHSDQISQNSRTQPEAKYFDFTRYLDDQIRYACYLSV